MKRCFIALITVVVVLYCGVGFALDPPAAYVKHCAACHAADGTGRASSAIGKIPDLRSKTIVKLSDEQLFNAIARGDAHKSYAHSFLHQGVSEEELRGIVKYVRAVQNGPANPVSARTTPSH